MDNATREAFVLEYYPYVQRVVHSMKRRLPSYIDADDLISIGTIGLIEALKNHGKQDEKTFPYYLKLRIRCSIVDGLRSNNLILKRETGSSLYENFRTIPLDEKILDYQLPGTDAPSDRMENQDRLKALNRMVIMFPIREQQILRLYFMERLTYLQIGKTLCLSESRISQIMTKTIKALREKLKDYDF